MLVPLTDRHMLIATVVATGLPVVVVARSTLGTINHTLLTLEALRSRGVEVLGVVLNGPPDMENARAIRTAGETTIIAEVSPLTEAVPSRVAVARAAGDFDPRGILIESLTASP